MTKILCVYFSRTGRTAKLVREIAQEVDCEVVKLDDGVVRKGLSGWLLSGFHAVSRKIPEVNTPATKWKLRQYDLVILATPVWAGRCSSPMRSFLQRFGDELHRVAYVITRSSGVRYDEVFEQMDQYVREPHLFAASIQPDTVGSDFWRDEFMSAVRGVCGEEQSDAGQA